MGLLSYGLVGAGNQMEKNMQNERRNYYLGYLNPKPRMYSEGQMDQEIKAGALVRLGFRVWSSWIWQNCWDSDRAIIGTSSSIPYSKRWILHPKSCHTPNP